MKNETRELLAIGSIVTAVAGYFIGEPVISLIGALMIFAAITVPLTESE